jgi:nicotinamide riboside kinase
VTETFTIPQLRAVHEQVTGRPYATWLWHERYVGADAPALRVLAEAHKPALYLLAGDEIGWEDDGTRDRCDERHWFQGRFRAELDALGLPHVSVVGQPELRLATAVQAIDRVLQASRSKVAGVGFRRGASSGTA